MEEKAGHSQVIAETPEGKVPLAQSTGVRSWCLLREANTASEGSAGPHGQPEPWTAGSLLPVVILSLLSHPWQCFAIFLTPSSPGAIPEQLSLSTAYLGGLVTPGVIHGSVLGLIQEHSITSESQAASGFPTASPVMDPHSHKSFGNPAWLLAQRSARGLRERSHS